jgi:hypothetical protein
MPWSRDPSVIHRQGHDYWRTWFLDECEQARLFGLNQKHLGLVRLPGKSIVPYQAGTRLYLEDAPWFPHTGELTHRVCGPYEVEPTSPLPQGAVPVHRAGDAIIVYKEAHPERGPWRDGSRLRRVDGQALRYRQLASEYNFFPFRFRIVPASDWRAEQVPHPASGHCWLCV